MRYRDYEFQKMAAGEMERDDKRLAQIKRNLPCKNIGNAEVHPIDGSCLRCGADQGEACRPL